MSEINNKYKKTCETSNFWFLLPIAGWSYMAFQKNKKEKLGSQQLNISVEKDQKMRGIQQASAALYHLDVFLSPVLETYTDKIRSLHDVFTDFHTNCKSFRDKVDKFENKANSQVDKKN